MTDTVTVGRTRGGERRERILAAAAELIADRGYHAVSMADIGISAGVVGPAIYRHFDSKAGLLAALFEQVIDTLLRRASAIVEQSRDDREALTALVADHVALVMEKRELAIVYYREVHNLPDHRRSRLRRKQRLYVEEWVHVLGELRPELTRRNCAPLFTARSVPSNRRCNIAIRGCLPSASRCCSRGWGTLFSAFHRASRTVRIGQATRCRSAEVDGRRNLGVSSPRRVLGRVISLSRGCQ